MPTSRVLSVLTLLALVACADDLRLSREARAPGPSDKVVAGLAGRARGPEEAARARAARPADVAEHQLADTSLLTTSVAPASTMLIRTGQVRIEVDSLDRAIRLAREAAARAGGYLANTSIQHGEGERRSATLEIKVPADRYDEVIQGLDGIGKVISATTATQDVGEEYVDVDARMANARRLEERLVSLLATRTGKLNDVLAVERELARVREEIERYEGRLRYLKAQTAMSTVTVTVFEPGPVVGQPGSNVVVEALKQAWRNCVSVVAGGIEVAGAMLPIAMLVGAALLVLRRWRRKVAGVATTA